MNKDANAAPAASFGNAAIMPGQAVRPDDQMLLVAQSNVQNEEIEI